MKKSHSITLTVVATIGLAARAQQIPLTPNNPLPPQSCEERVTAARLAGLPTTEVCGHAHGTVHGGFGATGKTRSSGG
jgi:hypothetical protein